MAVEKSFPPPPTVLIFIFKKELISIVSTKIKRVLLLQAFLLTIGIINFNVTASAATLLDKTPVQTCVEAMQPGWNLGNTFDASGKDETSWGNPVVTKELVDAVASYGFKSIRIPVTWNHRLGDAPDYKIDPLFLEKIEQVVDWSLDAGLYVMLNLHHDTSWIMKMETQHDETLAKYKAVWTQLSAYFGDKPDKLMFESINEPRFSEDWGEDKDIYFSMLDELNMAFYHVVRGSDKENNITRPLVLPTVTSSHTQARLDSLAETIAKLNDPNIIATIHYYGYWHFSVNIAGETTFGQNSVKDVDAVFDRAYNTFAEKGIPVIIGEYGLLGFDKATDAVVHSEVLKYFAYVGNYAREKGMTLMLWDNGQHLDRNSLTWHDESMYNTIMQSVKSPVAQAETEYVFVKANEEIIDAEIGLTLNGDELTEIQNNGSALSAGTDYIVGNDKLTILKGYIEKVLQKDFNSNAELKCKFKNSPDWSIYICYSDTPVLKDAARIGKNLEIETEFNGDKLITMEAKYKNGKGAGNQDWTTYKEFRADFYPDYSSGKIVLTDTFLRSLNNAEITLTMYFLSGETADYYLVKKDGKVTAGNTLDKASVTAEEAKPDNSKKSIASMPKASKTAEETEESALVQESVNKQTDTPDNSAINESATSSVLSVTGIVILVIIAVGIVVIAGVVIIRYLIKKR